MYARIRVRDSSEKPATGVACEDLQRIARPEAQAQGHAQKNPIKLIRFLNYTSWFVVIFAIWHIKI